MLDIPTNINLSIVFDAFMLKLQVKGSNSKISEQTKYVIMVVKLSVFNNYQNRMKFSII